MDAMPDHEVCLAVTGAVTVREPVKFAAPKGIVVTFETEIGVKKARNGLRIDILARGDSAADAKNAAVYFVGQALDVLALRLKERLVLNSVAYEFEDLHENSRRILSKNDLEELFHMSRIWSEQRPAFMRALSWFRKALNSDNPIDEFMAFWASVEGVSARCCDRTEKTAQGSINQICNCFDKVWGSSDHWRVIPGSPQTVNSLQEDRNFLAHGARPVNIELFNHVSEMLPILRRLTSEFLTSWESGGVQDERHIKG